MVLPMKGSYENGAAMMPVAAAAQALGYEVTYTPGKDGAPALVTVESETFRVNHRSWWREELPSESEYAEARANLDRAGWTVDYLLTHCGPTSIQNDLLGPLSKPDALTDFLEEIGQRCQFKYHFFGHYHRNEIVRKKCVLLYEQIIRLK